MSPKHHEREGLLGRLSTLIDKASGPRTLEYGRDVALEFECSASLDCGPGRERFCGDCGEIVWDASKMTRAEYDALPESACVMFSVDDNDQILFAKERSRVGRVSSKIAAAGALGLLLAGCEPDIAPVEPAQEVRPIPLDEPVATVPRTIDRAMLAEIHNEVFGEYPSGPPAPETRPVNTTPTRSSYLRRIQDSRNERQEPRRLKGKRVVELVDEERY